MFARFQDIKHGAIDDTGMSLNNVEAALNRVTLASGENMSIVNRHTGEFRDFSDVLKELYTVWDDLTEIEQANISKAMAGVRQREIFLTLMENEEMILGLLSESRDSDGLAAERYAIYLEGVESAQNKARASWEEMWQTTIDSSLVTAFYDASAGASEFITQLGGLTDALSLLFALLAGGAFAAGGLNTFISANPWVAIVTAISAATLAIVDFVTELNAHEEEAGRVVGELVRKTAEESDNFDDVVTEYVNSLDRIKQAYEDAPAWAKPFINQQDILDNALKEMLPLIAKNSGSWEEWISNLSKVAKATGYAVDQNGKLTYEMNVHGETITMQAEGFKLLDRTMFSLNEELDEYIYRQKLLREIAGENITRMSEFNEVFEKLLEMTSGEGAGDVGIDNLVQGFSDLNRMFREGVLAPDEYFEQIEQQLDILDMTDVFRNNDEAASLFFTGLVEGSTESLGHINELWQSGELSFSQYTDSLSELGDVFIRIGEISETFLGTDNVVSQAISNITDGVNSLREAQEMNVIVQDTMRQVTEEGLEFGTRAYNEQMELVAHAMEASGIMYTEANGNALRSANDILGYLTRVDGSFQILANQSANTTGQMIEAVVNGAGSMIVRLADMIDSFNASINFVPILDMGTINILGANLPWPNRLSIEVGADISVSRPTIGSGWGGLSEYGNQKAKSLTDMLRDVGSNFETFQRDFGAGDYGEGVFGEPRTFKSAAQEAENYADTLGSLTHTYNEAKQAAIDAEKEKEKASKAGAAAAKKAADEAEKAFKAQQDAEKDALKEKLRAYKAVIDTRKELLKTMQDELDYQRKLSAKQSDLSRLQAEIEEIRLDDSEEAAARRRALEEEVAEVTLDIAEAQADRRIDIQEAALDAEYQNYKRYIESKIANIDAIGTGTRVSMPSYHTGGIVDGKGSNEVVAKLLSGELVTTQSQMESFINTLLPSMLGTSAEMYGGDGMIIENLMPITVTGNLDSTVLPEINRIADRVVERLNQNMQRRGLTRNANAFLT